MKKFITSVIFAGIFLTGCDSTLSKTVPVPILPPTNAPKATSVSVNVLPEAKANPVVETTKNPISTKTSSASSKTTPDLAKLAQCLSKNGITMYGAYWCPHCKNQKSLFGENFQYIKYQECDPNGQGGNPKACNAAHVEGYPSWGMAGQKNLVGEQTAENLSRWSNCPLT